MRLKLPRSRPARRLLVLATGLASIAVLLALDGLPADLALLTARPAASEAAALTRQPETDFECAVAYVNDGDTLRCKDGTRVRLHAVAAREADETCSPGHPCPAASGASATARLNQLVEGKVLRCEQTGRSFNRVTAVCWTPAHEEVNCAMVRSGTTLVWDSFNRQRPLCRGRVD